MSNPSPGCIQVGGRTTSFLPFGRVPLLAFLEASLSPSTGLRPQPGLAAVPPHAGGTSPWKAAPLTPCCLHSPRCELTVATFCRLCPSPCHNRCCLGRVEATALDIDGELDEHRWRGSADTAAREGFPGCGRDGGTRTLQAVLLTFPKHGFWQILVTPNVLSLLPLYSLPPSGPGEPQCQGRARLSMPYSCHTS